MSIPATKAFPDPAAPATTKRHVGLWDSGLGMTLADLRATAEALAESEIVGLEVGELESAHDDQTPPRYVTALLDAPTPLLPTTAPSPC